MPPREDDGPPAVFRSLDDELVRDKDIDKDRKQSREGGMASDGAWYCSNAAIISSRSGTSVESEGSANLG